MSVARIECGEKSFSIPAWRALRLTMSKTRWRMSRLSFCSLLDELLAGLFAGGLYHGRELKAPLGEFAMSIFVLVGDLGAHSISSIERSLVSARLRVQT